MAPPARVERKSPLDDRRWKKFFDHTGRLAISVAEVKEAVFHGVHLSWQRCNNRVLIQRCDPKYGNSCWDYIRGLLPVTNVRRSDEVNEMNMSA